VCPTRFPSSLNREESRVPIRFPVHIDLL
jgi:hypothetical protein